MNNTTERSSILLVILGIDAPAGATRGVNVALLQNVFEQFGVLQKVIIFVKEAIVKAFVEFGTPEEAVEARAFLHGCALNNLGLIKTFFSALQKLDFSNRFVECKDFAPKKSENASRPAQNSAHKAKVAATENLSNQKVVSALFMRAKRRSDEQVLAPKNDFNNGRLRGEEAGHKGPADSDALSTQMTSVRDSLPDSAHSKADSKAPSRDHSKDVSVSRDTDATALQTCDSLTMFNPTGDVRRPSLFSIQPSATLLEAAEASHADLEVPEPLPASSPPAEAEADTTAPQPDSPPSVGPRVILLSNLDDFFLAASEIFNLFSCFGNIIRVLLMKNLKKALVEYKRSESAEAAIAFMNNRQFGRSKVKAVLSKYKKIDLKRNNKSENSQNFNEVIIVSNKMNRFKNSAQHVIAPTDTLLVVVEKATDLPLSDVILGVQLFGKPSRSKTLETEEPTPEVALHQVLFKFPNVVAAMKVLALAHNTDIKGHFLSVTFAPSMV